MSLILSYIDVILNFLNKNFEAILLYQGRTLGFQGTLKQG